MDNNSVKSGETKSSSATANEDANGLLSQEEVIRRLFSPSENVPETRQNEAVVIVTAGETERAVTHRQIENLIGHGIAQLKNRGISEGRKVVFYCQNSPEFTSTILACWSLNALAVLVDYRTKRTDVIELCKKLSADLLITSKGLYKDFAGAVQSITVEGFDVLEVSSFADFKDSAPEFQPEIPNLDLDKPAFSILTSGTTGTPKTSVHSLRSLVCNLIDLADTAGEQGRFTVLTPLPISHVFGLSVFLISQILGAKTVLTPLEPTGFVKAVHRHKPEWIAALPQFYGALLAAPEGYINLDNAKLLLCGGTPPTISLVDKFESTFGKILNNGYGSTECKLVALNKDGPALSVGKPIGSVKIDIVNEQDEVLPEGEIGEVRVTGSMLMNGYIDNEKETQKVLHDGHYYTGDIGRFENGYLFVVGRKGDVIIVGGAVVNAGIVEEALRNNHEVKDVAVTAVKNKWLGQIIKATVVLVDDKLEDAEMLRRQFKSFCRQHLSRHQRPMKWEFLGPHQDLPKTLAGKTDKKKMLEEQ